MTTCRDIITYALRQTKVVGINGSPTAPEANLGLVALQSLYDQWVADGMFGRLQDVTLTANDNVEEGYRYYVPTGYTLTEAATIAAEDSDTGRVRQPRDLAIYESLTEAGTRTVKVYDRTAWVSLLSLTLDSDAPLAGRGALGLAACLAVSGGFVAAFGAEPSPDTRMLARNFIGSLASKSGSTRDREPAEYM